MSIDMEITFLYRNTINSKIKKIQRNLKTQ